MDFNQIKILIDKYLNGQATQEERKVVDDWYESCEAKPGLSEVMSEEALLSSTTHAFLRLQEELKF